MKTQLRFLSIILLSTMIFCGCEEEPEGLLKDLAEGKMVVIVNNGAEVLMDCSFGQYGQGGGLTGEVFITGIQLSAQQQKHFSIMYGSYTNTIPFAAKTYKSNGAEGSGVYVNCWAGTVDDDAIMTVNIISVTEAVIKGEFEGEVKNGEGVKSTIKGAFWALRQAE